MTIATYTRISTDQQDPQRQRQLVRDYAADKYPSHQIEEYADISTGTDTDRESYSKLMHYVEREHFEAVVCTSVSRISRSIRDLSRTVDHFDESQTALHFTNEPIEFLPDEQDPYNKAMLQLLGVFAELEANMIQQRTKDAIATLQAKGYNFGRAPLGYDKQDGEIYPAHNYDLVCTTLELVQNGEMSKRQAAKKLNCARKTITNAINKRPELYDLTHT